ncbi:hypothetical protein QEN19_000086 [Hanseniaspora menglaensis]
MSSSLLNLINIKYQDTNYKLLLETENSDLIVLLETRKKKVLNLLSNLKFFEIDKKSKFKKDINLGKINVTSTLKKNTFDDSPTANPKYDILLVYSCIDLLLEFVSDLSKLKIRNSDFFVSIIFLIKLYHNQGHFILHLNYVTALMDSSQMENLSWKKSQYCFQCANGLSKLLLQELEILKSTPLYSQILDEKFIDKANLIFFFNVSYQQFAYVIFALFKIQNKILENYSDDNLFKNEKSVDGLSYNGLAKMVIQVIRLYDVIIDSSHADSPYEIKIFYKEYLTALLYVFQGLQAFTIENKIGRSCGYINSAYIILIKSKLFKEFMETYEVEYKSWQKGNTKGTMNYKQKLESWKEKSKKLRKKIISTNFTDDLILNSFEKFIVPLVFTLKYRIENYNNLVAFESIPGESELKSYLPYVKNIGGDLINVLNNSKCINWVINNDSLSISISEL